MSKLQRIILLVDNSGSMDGKPIEDIKQSLAMLKEEINNHNKINKDNKKLEVITFSSEAKLISNNALHHISASGGTNISSAYKVLRNRLHKVSKDEVFPIIILLSDGATGENGEAKKELNKLKRMKVFAKSKRLAFAYNNQTFETKQILSDFTQNRSLVFFERSSKILKHIIGSLLPKVIFKKKRPKIQINVLSNKVKILKNSACK